MQLKTTVRYHLTPVRMAAIKKSTSNQFWRGCREKEPSYTVAENKKIVQPLWRTVWRFLKKLETELPYNCIVGHTIAGIECPAISLLGIYTKETRIERDTCTPHLSTVYNSQDTEAI